MGRLADLRIGRSQSETGEISTGVVTLIWKARVVPSNLLVEIPGKSSM